MARLLGLLLLAGPAQPAGAAQTNVASIWPSTAAPATLMVTNDKSSVELGLKFRSAIDGSIAGIRFYKGPANSGPHQASVWTRDGTLLASVTFSNETASGWQYQVLPNRVPISSNTTYVVSYHAPAGWYSADAGAFATSGVNSYPLRALANGEDGANGVFLYGAGGFPTNSLAPNNYWVDVVFAETNGTDTIPPMVCATSPGPGADGLHVNTPVTVTFSEALKVSTINSNTLTLYDSLSNAVGATVSWNSSTATATLKPTYNLQAATTYTVTVKGGASGIADAAGNPLSQNYTWSFTTLPAAPYGNGPGGPILILSSPKNPFGEYYAEILLAEGLNEFAMTNISSVSSTLLAQYDLVLLAQMALTPAQVTVLSNWVTAGGNLIAMRPDKQLAGLLGLVDTGTNVSDGYLLINTAAAPGAGLLSQPLQFHGIADRYRLGSATNLATLYADAQTATTNPAVTLRSVGSKGGRAATFTYDLAKSVIYTRQGNPAWAGQDRDGLTPIRSDDLFYGAASFDPKPDWVDFNKLAIPQADEQQRLLANLILYMNATKRSLPRFWYFPSGFPAAVVMTGDNHVSGGIAGRFNQYMALSPTNASVEDWQAIRGSAYTVISAAMSSADASAYNAAGFEIALHLDTGCANWTRGSLSAMFADQLGTFAALYPNLPAPVSHRIHCVVWSDYSTLPEVERLFGIRLDVSQYFYPASWVSNRPGLFTGSAMPMRFATAEGSVLDVYGAPTQMTDESGQSFPYTCDALLDKAVGPEGYWGAFVANMHADTAISASSDAIIASARARGVPVITARQLLTWLDARNGSSFQAITSTKTNQAFSVQASANARGLQGMVPVPTGSAVTSLTCNGTALSYSLKGVKGLQYAMFPAVSGSYEVRFAPDTTPPRVAALQPANGTREVNPATNVVVAFSEAMAPASLSTNTITLRDPAGRPVPAQLAYNPFTLSAVLTPQAPLRYSNTYTLTISGGAGGVTDLAGNALASNVVASFTTRVVHSLWDDSATPAQVSSGDPSEIEVGMKFLSAEDGYVTGIRFYKAPANTGVHVGSLWTSTGQLLGSVTFANETASGWQVQPLPLPVPIASNQVYVVSYHAPNGNYSVSPVYFAATGVDRYPLHALANGESGGNGVFRYGPRAFPDQTYNSANYWVDVVTGLPESWFWISSLTVSQGVATVSWGSAPGRSYCLQYKDSLGNAPWTNLAPAVTATGMVVTVTNALGPNPMRFYRVWNTP